MGQKLKLVDNGTGDAVAQDWVGGKGTFVVVYNAATSVSLELLADDGSTWIAAGVNTTFTGTDGVGAFELAPCQLRAQIVGTTTGVYATVIGNGR